MFKRYEVQVALLEDTLQRQHPVNWVHVKYCRNERHLRKCWWQRVSHSTERLIYRMYDNKKNEVIQ